MNGLQKMLVDREKAEPTAKTTLKRRRRNHASSTDKRVVAFEVHFSETKAAYAQLVGISAQFVADDAKAWTDLEGTKIRFGEIEPEAKLASATQDEDREQYVKLAKVAEDSFC